MVPIQSPPVTDTTSSEPPLPTLLQRRATNPRRNAGVPPRQWWTTWEPGTNTVTQQDQLPDTSDRELTSVDNEQEFHNDDPEQETETITTALSTWYTDPQTYKEAMECADSRLWIESMGNEMNNHLENGTWDYVELPPGARTIGSKWVYQLKHLADGAIECHRSRIVVKGFTQ